MSELNFLEIFHNEHDKLLLTGMTDEIISLYGFPCIHKKWAGIQTVLDPLYDDLPSMHQKDEDLYEFCQTYVYVDYNRFNEILYAYGHGMQKDLSINGMMKLKDSPKEDDLVTIKLPYDEKYLTFRLGSTDVHRDICYSVVLNVSHFEQKN